MRVAVLISGYLRSFKDNLDNIKTNVVNKFDNVDIYIHITQNENNDDRYLNDSDIKKDVEYIIDNLTPTSIIIEPNYNSNTTSVVNQWSKYYKINSIKKINEEIGSFRYDYVIKLRPDIFLINEIDKSVLVNNDIVYIAKDTKIDKQKLTKENDNYICDIMAIGSSEIMDKYFNIYNRLNQLIENYGQVSETLLYHYLNDENIGYNTIDIDYKIILSKCNIFAICGDSGSGKTTLGNLLKKYFNNSFMLECDRYHKWERGDENWSKFTHLNPNANHLEKMSDDIFDLKVGKTIYHVDYDHSTGKFTEKEEINSSENIIVCGLHSMLLKNQSPYDLKIYIDTDNNLKNKWKIKRDVTERGYTLDRVLKQIEHRKSDYNKFIKPQKQNSDIIINFFTDKGVDSTDVNSECNIYLSIKISVNHNIKKLINTLKPNNQIIIKKGTKFNEIIINQYKDLPIFDSLLFKNNDYYDYILYVILNLI